MAIGAILLFIFIMIPAGEFLGEDIIIPVKNATSADWNHNTFWAPWGKSCVHKGIDIFAKEGTPVIASCRGVVVYTGYDHVGGNFVFILSSIFRIHYFAHLQTVNVSSGKLVSMKQEIGKVGTTGNAAGKPPHLHYSIISLVPDTRNFALKRFDFSKLFYRNPHEELMKRLRVLH